MPAGIDRSAAGVPVYGGVEGGGTKLVCVVGTGPGDVRATQRIATGPPGPTIAAAVGFFREVLAGGMALQAIGLAWFGPVELRREHPAFGHVTSTPKPGWSGVDVVGPFREALGLPIGFAHDVGGAALAEGRWGAARGSGDFVYLTLGTGIGGAAVAGGQLLGGLGHPEMGHVAVPRHPGDAFAGTCPFHGDCWEGLGAGPAIGARFGRPTETLEGTERERAADLAGYYLAAGVRSLTYVLAPARVVVGGGLASMPGVLEAARRHLEAQLAGYPGLPEHVAEAFLVPAGLGDMAGPLGALAVAEAAAGEERGVASQRR